jgi:hypothetical protein
MIDEDHMERLNLLMAEIAELLQEEKDMTDIMFVLGRLCSMFLAFGDDEFVDGWIKTMKNVRQDYISKGIREGGDPPTLQ